MKNAEVAAERIKAEPCGAQFYRADLHIHSRNGSHDVSDSTMTPDRIVQTAIDEKLDIIAITDHNDVSNVGAAIAASEGKPILVIPGVELSTTDGHLLVYFRDLDKLNRYMAQLDIADSGTSNSRCRGSMIECLNKIDRNHGFAILAHVDGPKGLETSITGYPPQKTDIVTHKTLLGIELLRASSPISFKTSDPEKERARIGKQRQVALGQGPDRFLARVLFSDSHSLAALGRNAAQDRKVTRVKMDVPTFDGVVHALIDEDARIRLEDEIPMSVPRILGVQIDGGFLDGTVVQMSPNLNCIIGGRGAGKSTMIEVIRSVAPSNTESTLVDSEVWPLSLHLVWVDEAGQHHTVRRRMNSTAENLDDADLGPVVFPIECYGQGETAETSRKAVKDSGALLAYLDQFVEIAVLRERDQQLRDDLLENQTKLESADREIAQIPAYERAENAAKTAAAALEKTNARDVLILEQRLANEASIRAEIGSTIEEIVVALKKDEISGLVGRIGEIKGETELKTGHAQMKAIEAMVAELTVRVGKAGEQSRTTAEWLRDGVTLELATWREEEKGIREEIEKKRKELEEQGHKLDIAFIRKVTKDLADHRAKLVNLRNTKKNRASLAADRRELLKQRVTTRGAISTARQAFGVRASRALTGEVGDLEVSVKFKADAYSPEGENLLIDALDWRTVQVPRAAALVQELTIPALLACIARQDVSPITALSDGAGEQIFRPVEGRRILEVLSTMDNTYALQRCEVQDQPRITVTRNVSDGAVKKVVTRDFARLSLGQQQSVLLGLMLSSDSRQPLIIDQPEDNLDGEFIYFTLVKALRRAKERRQIIIVTHNANIAVLADVEQIIALKSFSDRGRIVARGGIDDPATNKIACAILEGSAEAFRRRAEAYTPSLV